jgi:hypothetical protein
MSKSLSLRFHLSTALLALIFLGATVVPAVAAVIARPAVFSEFIRECSFYFFPMLFLHGFIFVMYGAGLEMMELYPSAYYARLRRLALFLTILLCTGALFNGLWSCLVVENLYSSTNELFYFTPFFPIADVRRLVGISMLQLEGIWAVYATNVWVVTILIYIGVKRSVQWLRRPIDSATPWN